MSALALGVCAYPVTAPASLGAWQAKIEALIAEASGRAELLLFPEYASMELAAAIPGAAEPAAEFARIADAADAILEIWRAAARRHRVWLAPGTLPWQGDRGIRNRAPLIAPDGRVAFQDKQSLTRFEQDAARLARGDTCRVFETPWGRLGLVICYDVEFPDLVRARAEAGAWLMLVPSCTDTPHGQSRVRIAARARALEAQCFVAMAPTVGEAPGLATLDRNVGQAAIFGPVDHGFSEDGIVAELAPDTPGWLFARLDAARLEAVRAGGAVRNWHDRPRTCPPCHIEASLLARP